MNDFNQNASTTKQNEINISQQQPKLRVAQRQKPAVVPIKAGFTQFEVINAIYDSKIFSEVKLTAGARLVLISLARHYNPANDEFFPSYSCIAAHTGVSKKSVERAIKELVNAGLITYRTEKVNRYRFTGHFFASVNLSLEHRQNDGLDQGHFDDQTNNHEKRNNHEKSFSKNSFLPKQPSIKENNQNIRPNGINVKSQNQVENTKIYSLGAYRASGQNDVGMAISAYNSNKVSGGSGRYVVPPSERKGGSSFTPSVSATNDYLKSCRDARAEACSPLDFDYERAKSWYASLSAPLRKTSLACRLVEKFPQLLNE